MSNTLVYHFTHADLARSAESLFEPLVRFANNHTVDLDRLTVAWRYVQIRMKSLIVIPSVIVSECAELYVSTHVSLPGDIARAWSHGAE